MTHEEMTLLVIKDAIDKAPPEERAKIDSAAEELRAVLAKHGAWGSVGLALVGAELAAA